MFFKRCQIIKEKENLTNLVSLFVSFSLFSFKISTILPKSFYHEHGDCQNFKHVNSKLDGTKIKKKMSYFPMICISFFQKEM